MPYAAESPKSQGGRRGTGSGKARCCSTDLVVKLGPVYCLSELVVLRLDTPHNHAGFGEVFAAAELTSKRPG